MTDHHPTPTAGTDTFTIVSPYRPLTRSARRALDDFDIIDEHSPREAGRQTVLEVGDKPPTELLKKHELLLEQSPERVYRTGHGERVEIYEDRVIAENTETTMDPEDAIAHAESRSDWDRLHEEES